MYCVILQIRFDNMQNSIENWICCFTLIFCTVMHGSMKLACGEAWLLTARHLQQEQKKAERRRRPELWNRVTVVRHRAAAFYNCMTRTLLCQRGYMNKFSNKFSWKAFCRVKLLSTQLAITVDNTLLPSSTVQSFSRSVIPVVYIKSTVDQRAGKWQSKNRTIFVDTIIYQLHTYTCNRYFSSDIVSQPEDGLSRPKHVVGILLYLQI